jgi:hypothetical protein
MCTLFHKLIGIWENTSFQTIVEKKIWASMKPLANDNDHVKNWWLCNHKFSLRVGKKLIVLISKVDDTYKA